MATTRNKKRHFKCGHTGHGRWCHRCEQAGRLTRTNLPEANRLLATQASAKSRRVDSRPELGEAPL